MGGKGGDGGGGLQLVRRACAKSGRQNLSFRKTVNHFLNGMFGGKNMKGATAEDELRTGQREYSGRFLHIKLRTLEFAVDQ